MTTYTEAYAQGRKAFGSSTECPYIYESVDEQLYNAWWKGFEERCEEVEAENLPGTPVRIDRSTFALL